MGAAESVGDKLHEYRMRDPAIENELRNLSATAQPFLSTSPSVDMTKFEIDSRVDQLQALMKLDPRLTRWLPKLVPKRVSEEQFWLNYYSHILALAQRSEQPGYVQPSAPTAPVTSITNPSPSPLPIKQVQVLRPGTPLLQQPSATIQQQTQTQPSSQPQSPSPHQAKQNINSTLNDKENGEKQQQQQQPSDGKLEQAENKSGQIESKPGHPGATITTTTIPTATESASQVLKLVVVPRMLQVQGNLMLELPPLITPMYQKPKVELRWGIIGCGSVVESLALPALQRCEGSRVVAVMRRTPALAKAFATNHQIPRFYTQTKSLIEDEEVDAIYIASPPGTHVRYALEVAAAGKPCLIEKPCGRSLEETRTICEEFSRTRLPLYTAYYLRTSDRFIRAKQLIESGVLGPVTSIEYRFFGPHLLQIEGESILPLQTPQQQPQQQQQQQHPRQGWKLSAEHSGGGLFMQYGAHALDTLDFLFGPLTRLQGDAVSILAPDVSVETVVACTFRTQSRALGSATWNFVSGMSEDRLVVTGSKLQLSMSMFGGESPVVTCRASNSSAEIPCKPGEHGPYQSLIQSIVSELSWLRANAKGISASAVSSTADNAMRTSTMVDAALRVFYKTRTDHFWKRPHTWGDHTHRQ